MSRYIELDEVIEITAETGAMVTQIRAQNLPSIDIVRCGECKHWNYEMSGCRRNPSVVAWRDDDFCSYGESKESE